MILENYSMHVITVMLLPIFTLNYQGGSQGRKDMKTIELKIKRRIRRETESNLDIPDDPSALYDADDDLLSDHEIPVQNTKY